MAPGILWRAIRAGVALVLASVPAAAATHEASLEIAVKATFLYKFAPFVEWPDAARGGPAASVRLCIVGDDPFGSVLDRAVAGQRMGERPFTVHRLSASEDGRDCHILYLAPAPPADVVRTLRVLDGLPVLTVTDRAAAAETKGVINFVLVDGRVRFEIDGAAATRNGLAISSKLLSLAVNGGSRG
ncbi:YfiR family protein [Azospirillum halopraeferens]|uniref:YfiR family protein n=1 Tax=Azospirillum halopraeferens TaxID=34010 RepID=UPI000491A2A7|nr:YfiR family protein [Azospirillum halopraeferens]